MVRGSEWFAKSCAASKEPPFLQENDYAFSSESAVPDRAWEADLCATRLDDAQHIAPGEGQCKPTSTIDVSVASRVSDSKANHR